MFTRLIKIDEKGALLLEILVVVGILAVIVSFGSQLFLTSARTNKWSRERNVAVGLAEEVYEGLRGVASEDWLNIYRPPDGTGDESLSKGSSNHYYLSASGTKWVVKTGDESVVLDGLTYTRYFVVENTSRDVNTRNIEGAYNATNNDPSTQKITISISWPNADPYVMTQYLTRWRNKVCAQTNWSAGAISGTTSCPTEGYGAIDANIDVGTVGSIKLKSQ